MSRNLNLTKEQNEVINEEGNLVVTANPGSGKTLTIVEKILNISQTLYSYQGVIAISFTRQSSKELEVRYNKKKTNDNNHFFGTIDKFYISEIIIPFSKQICGIRKSIEVINSLENHPQYESLLKLKENSNNQEINVLLEKSLKEGLIFLEICGETALYILKKVPQCAYYLKSRYTHIFIDEYQDCGEIQHKIFLELINHGIKGIAVGDLNQAIFAFSYRFPKYLHSLIGNQDFRHVLLTRNFRCHKSISDYSLQLIEKRKVTNTDVKRVFKVNVIGNDKTVIDAIEKNFVNLKKKYKLNNNDFAILCHSRSSAKRASKFLNIKNKLFDYIDFEKETGILANFYKDLLNSYFLYKINKTTVLDFVIKYLNEEVNYFNFRKGLETVNEIFNLEVTNFVSNIEKFYDLAQLVYPDDFDEVIFNKLVELLKNRKDLNSFKPATEDEINIMTVHKSKGLEFKCVFLLDLYKYVFPRENIDEESLNQYLHLHYVGITRAIEACYIIVATERYRPSKEDYCNAIESPFLCRNNVQDLREDIIWKI